MELIGEAWLLYAEGMALQGKQVSMTRLLDKLKSLVQKYEFRIPRIRGAGPRRADADRFAKGQLELFKKQGRYAVKRSADLQFRTHPKSSGGLLSERRRDVRQVGQQPDQSNKSDGDEEHKELLKTANTPTQD